MLVCSNEHFICIKVKVVNILNSIQYQPRREGRIRFRSSIFFEENANASVTKGRYSHSHGVPEMTEIPTWIFFVCRQTLQLRQGRSNNQTLYVTLYGRVHNKNHKMR